MSTPRLLSTGPGKLYHYGGPVVWLTDLPCPRRLRADLECTPGAMPAHRWVVGKAVTV